MDALLKGLQSGQTTGVGTALGAAYYAQNVGFRLPQNGQEWAQFAISSLIFILGLLAKDATKA